MEATRDGTTVRLRRGDRPVTVVVDGTPVQVDEGETARMPLRPLEPLLPEPRQPVGREPRT